MQPQRIVVEGSETPEAPMAAQLRLREARSEDGYAPSPALALQDALAAQLAEPYVEPWPLAVRFSFMVVSSVALWAAIIMSGLSLARGF
jgi:hypothetical protein